MTIPPRTTKTVTAFVDNPSEWETTGTMTPLEKFTETTSLLLFHSISTVFDRKVAVRVTNTTETSTLIKTATQIAKFSVVTREQAKSIKPVDMAILSTISENDPELTAYLNEHPSANKLEQQSKTFWFPTPKNPSKNEDHTPIQTRILKKLYELKEKEKLNPKDDTKSRKKFLKGLIVPIQCQQ